MASIFICETLKKFDKLLIVGSALDVLKSKDTFPSLYILL